MSAVPQAGDEYLLSIMRMWIKAYEDAPLKATAQAKERAQHLMREVQMAGHTNFAAPIKRLCEILAPESPMLPAIFFMWLG